MRTFPAKRSLAVIVFLGVLAATIGSVEPRLRHGYRERFDVPVTPHPYTRYLVFGHGRGVSAAMWLRLLSWYGGLVRRNRGAFALDDIDAVAFVKQQLDMLIALDPEFPDPYSFGAIVLSWYAEQPLLAMQFCEQGAMQFPDDWTYPFYCGFIQYKFMHDNQAAADYFIAAGQKPNVPAYVPLLGTKLLQEHESTRSALETTRALLQAPIAPQLKEKFEQEAATLETILAVEDAVARYRERYQRVPAIKDLLAARMLEAPPVDATGKPIIVGADGKVSISQGKTP